MSTELPVLLGEVFGASLVCMLVPLVVWQRMRAPGAHVARAFALLWTVFMLIVAFRQGGHLTMVIPAAAAMVMTIWQIARKH